MSSWEFYQNYIMIQKFKCKVKETMTQECESEKRKRRQPIKGLSSQQPLWGTQLIPTGEKLAVAI